MQMAIYKKTQLLNEDAFHSGIKIQRNLRANEFEGSDGHCSLSQII